MAKTKRDYFAEIRTIVADNKELVDFIDHEVELLDRKRTGSRKPTAKQIENEGIKEKMLDALATAEKPVTIAELKGICEDIAGMNPQKIAPLLNMMVAAGEVEKTYVKKVAHFALVPPAEDAE